MRLLIAIACILTALFSSCSGTSVNSTKEFSAWLNNRDNGCVVSKDVNGMTIEIRYMPPSYLALKEAESSGKGPAYDSLLASYEHSATFLIAFRPLEGHEGEDVMYKNVRNFREYVERSQTLNFDLESKIQLRTDQGEYHPVLSSFENSYGLTRGREVYLVFAPSAKANELDDAAYYEMVYTDDIYDLGILHFKFDPQTIQKRLPHVTLKQS